LESLEKEKRIRIFFSDFCEIVIYTIDNFTFYRLKTKKKLKMPKKFAGENSKAAVAK